MAARLRVALLGGSGWLVFNSSRTSLRAETHSRVMRGCVRKRCLQLPGPACGIHVLTRVLVSQVRAHQLVLPPCDVVIKAVADYVRNIQDPSDLDAVAKDVFQHSQVRTWEDACEVCCSQILYHDQDLSPKKTDLSRGLSRSVDMTCPSFRAMVRDFFHLFLERNVSGSG